MVHKRCNHGENGGSEIHKIVEPNKFRNGTILYACPKVGGPFYLKIYSSTSKVVALKIGARVSLDTY
jgi:hypothetical protein